MNFKKVNGNFSGWMNNIKKFISKFQYHFYQQENKKKINAAFSNSKMAMALLSPKWRCLKVNTLLCQTLGFTSKELFNLDFQRIIHSDDFYKNLPFIKKMLDGEIKQLEVNQHFLHENGDAILVHVKKSVMRDKSGKLLYYVLQLEPVY